MKTKFLSACILSVALVAAPMSLQAEMVNTNQLLAGEERGVQIELVETFLAREEVRKQMASLGVDPAMAAERVAGMTDSQLQQLALNIQAMPAGSGALGLVVVVLVIVILLEILGVTDMSRKV